eukprot:6329455-Prymnesium_polylepis.2
MGSSTSGESCTRCTCRRAGAVSAQHAARARNARSSGTAEWCRHPMQARACMVPAASPSSTALALRNLSIAACGCEPLDRGL